MFSVYRMIMYNKSPNIQIIKKKSNIGDIPVHDTISIFFTKPYFPAVLFKEKLMQ